LRRKSTIGFNRVFKRRGLANNEKRPDLN